MARIYTKTGDDGTTGLLFGGRASKSDDLIEVFGDIDEAAAALGIARANSLDQPLSALLLHIQRELFVVAADLATNPRQRHRLEPGKSQVTAEMLDALERNIDALVAQHPLRPLFVIPGSTPNEAAIDFARAVTRRAERHVVRARAAGHAVSTDVLRYLNRLSDLLYVLARQAARTDNEPASHD
jgi:cob(I)alamin adenosyltransferase